MFSNFTEDTRKVLTLCKKEMDCLNNKEISSIHFLLGTLSLNNDLTKLLKKYNLTYKLIKENVKKEDKKCNNKYYLYKKEFKSILEKVVIESKDLNIDITLNNLFFNVISSDTDAYRLLLKLDINIDKLREELNVSKKRKKSYLDSIGINLNNKYKNSKQITFYREKEINRIIEILNRKTKNNPILLGDAGVGKTAIIEELARKIERREVPSFLINKKIIELDISSLVSGTKYRGDFEEKINKIVNEVILREDVILFIDEIHTLVGAGSSNESTLDLSNILKPYLARGNLRLIGASTYNEFSKTLEKDKALERRFQKVNIKEPNKETLKDILMNIKPTYENYHNVRISEDIIDNIIKLSSKYIYDRKEPDKSIDILDEVSSRVNVREIKEIKDLKKIDKELIKVTNTKKIFLKRKDFKNVIIYRDKELELLKKKELINYKLLNKNIKKKVTIEDVKKVISEKSNVPILDDLDIEKIKEDLSSKIINQDIAINELISVIKKIKYGLNKSKPYSLLFSGNTGVGKTCLAKEFGNLITKSIIKIDMNEYTTPESINKLIGSPKGYIGYDEPTLLDNVKTNPYSLVILDEIEKCHRSILNFFLNILDEGYAIDNKGNKINFNNTLIIMTTNAVTKKKSLGYINSKTNSFECFPKEFINRIDEVIEFNDMNINSIKQIIDNELSKYNKENNLKIRLEKEDIDNIILKSDYKIFGVRKLNRLLMKLLDNKVLSNI